MSRSGRVLLFSYAFPPLRVPMAPCVAKTMAGFAAHGVEVDVVTADPDALNLPCEDDLIPYAERQFSSVRRIRPPRDWLTRLRLRSSRASSFPDPTQILGPEALRTILDMAPQRYAAIVTWSPFHAVNPVMVRLKRLRPGLRWIAQFSDPWCGNPLERSRWIEVWNRRHERDMVGAADRIVHTSSFALDAMMEPYPEALRDKALVLPHSYDASLYPAEARRAGGPFIIRYLGQLYPGRSPEPFIRAMERLVQADPTLSTAIRVEFYGSVAPDLLHPSTMLPSVASMIKQGGNLGYIESLGKMRGADLLLLLDLGGAMSLFLPSKLADYIGAGVPILGIVPRGAASEALREMGALQAAPSDVDGIAAAVRVAYEAYRAGRRVAVPDPARRATWSNKDVAGRFLELLGGGLL